MTAALTDDQAYVLLAVGEEFATRKEMDLRHMPESARALESLESLGLVERKRLGARALGWRLTASGQAAKARAQVAAEEAKGERMRQWEADNMVYGRPRACGATPLSAIQQRAWVRGYMEAQVAAMDVPTGAPDEVRATFEEHRAWLLRRMAAHCPYDRKVPGGKPGKGPAA